MGKAKIWKEQGRWCLRYRGMEARAYEWSEVLAILRRELGKR